MLFQRTGDLLDISDGVIEKDLWICWVLEKLFSLPIPMTFKGGTSLSKAYGLIDRFSEDIDITLDNQNFIGIDIANANRSQLKKLSETLKNQLKLCVNTKIYPQLVEITKSEFPEKIFKFELSVDGEQLRFYYPSQSNGENDYLRDHILLEFGMRNSTEPRSKCVVAPYLNHVLDNSIRLPIAHIDTLSPVRTFWEKATLIHVECHRERLESSPARLSRHWYDLFMLNNAWVSKVALEDRKILNSVIEHKKAFFNASYAHYDDCLKGLFRLIPDKTRNIVYSFSIFNRFGSETLYPPVKCLP